ncbi:SUKH-4 family immunity protein [Kitasatospora kifunensis]|uniref:SUKH-4 immunity protein n=1 Tax=Kitasatospora kifunensis TaxID=58351 RepID=A0A7W7VTS1_KITKI|nr:SUKH-4 family immunity protein [Kitasatospora kifunensis]MBB4922063.1 hypothetical protein [Kitasatospora kifunensis]
MQLKVDIDRDRITGWFGPDGTVCLSEQALPAALIHEPTRRLLTELGLPRQGGTLTGLDFLRFETDPEVLLRPLADQLDDSVLAPRQATFAPSRRPARTLAAPAESPSTSSTRTSGRHAESTHMGAPPGRRLGEPLLDGQRLPDAALGTDHLLMLGTVQRDRLVLDGRTGQVALAGITYGKPAEVLLDVLASDLSVVLLFLHELAALRSAACDPAAQDGRRGPAVLAEVTGAVERRLRAVDPALFEPSGVAALWSAALLVYGLCWGARPGAWAAELGGHALAYEITSELMAELGEVQPLHPDDLPAGLRHQPTRQLLTSVGLPVTDRFSGDQQRPLATLGERCPWYAEEPADRAHQLDYFLLGATAYNCQVVLDGVSGRVEITEGDGEEGWPAAQLACDLSAYYLAIWVLTRLREAVAQWSSVGWQVFDLDELLAEAGLELLARLDPSAVAREASLWNALADDGHMGGLLG